MESSVVWIEGNLAAGCGIMKNKCKLGSLEPACLWWREGVIGRAGFCQRTTNSVKMCQAVSGQWTMAKYGSDNSGDQKTLDQILV